MTYCSICAYLKISIKIKIKIKTNQRWVYTLEDLKWDKMQFFKVYPFQENVNFDYIVSSNTTDEF